MSLDRTVGHRRTRSRACRPTLDGDGRLESRVLLSNLPGSVFLKHPKPGVAYVHNQPPFLHGSAAHHFPVASFPRGPQVAVEVAHGGQSAIIGTPDGSHFIVQVTQFIPTPGGSQGSASPNSQNAIQGVIPGGSTPVQPLGTIRGYAMSHGRVGLIIDGSTTQTEVDISPYPFHQRKGYAHSFAYGQTNETHLLNVGKIVVNSGVISAINGFHTTQLSGPLTIKGNQPVDRLSFNALLPGASIQTGSDLDTLDVLNGVTLNKGPGILIGRDLNLFNAGQDVNLSNGASIRVGRFLGLTPQPPKGTATGGNFLAVNQALIGTGTSTVVPSLSSYIQGNLIIGPGSVFMVNNGIPNTSIIGGNVASSAPSVLLINGQLNTSSGTFSQLQIPGLSNLNTGTTLINQDALAPPIQAVIVNSIVARSGSNIAGFGP
jgi:hypothetical protein